MGSRVCPFEDLQAPIVQTPGQQCVGPHATGYETMSVSATKHNEEGKLQGKGDSR